jgi:hypothetical protein
MHNAQCKMHKAPAIGRDCLESWEHATTRAGSVCWVLRFSAI